MKYTAENGRIRTLSKQTPSSEAEGEFTGIARFDAVHLPDLREASEELLAAGHTGSFFEHALQSLIDQSRLTAAAADIGSLAWCEIDFPEDYARARQLFEKAPGIP